MEIRQLEAFAAVFSAGSVTGAARLLERSQPVVSRQLQDLEHELGFTLFARTRPQVTLTEQGRQFYEEVHNVLAGLQQLDSRTREISRGQPRPLRIAATFSLSCMLVPAVVARLEHTRPVFMDKMNIEAMQAEHVVRAVADGKADIGLTSLPMDLGRCQLSWSGQAPCLMALAPGHPLAQGEVVRLADLGDTTVITMSNRSGLRHRLSTALLQGSPAGKPRRHIETNAYLNALMLVKAGIGVALADPFTVATASQENVVFKPIDTHIPYMMGVLTHRDRVLTDEGQRFVRAAWDYASECIPGFVRGHNSGLPMIGDPSEMEDAMEAKPD